MKTVTGTVLSRKPISLSKATSILSNFVSAETGASHAVCAYLRRASFAFNELSQLHKELKPHRRKQRTPRSKTHAEEEDVDGDPTRSAVSSQPELTQELSRGIENLEGNWGKLGIEKDGNLGVENEGRKKKKQHKKEEKGKIGIEEDGDVRMENGGKKDRKKKEKSRGKTGIENRGGIVVEEERRKKRKSGDIEDGVERLQMISEELRSKKKKRRKIEGES